MEEKQYYVYIITNYNKTTFYVGVTSDLEKRMYQHSNKLIESFTSKYRVFYLMYYEIHNDVEEAILREKKLKRWKKEWKWDLIDKVNPGRKNLYAQGTVLPIDPASSAG